MILKEAKEREAELKKQMGKPLREVTRKIEQVLKSNRIDKPYYHGGKYNGKAMNRFMTQSSNIMSSISDVIIDVPEADRCSNVEVREVTEKFSHVLHVFDAVFSKARVPSRLVLDENVAELQLFVREALRLWRGLELSVSPKVHAIEDHLCDQIVEFGGIGDLGEDLVEQSHQDGIKDHRRTKMRLIQQWQHSGILNGSTSESIQMCSKIKKR